VGETKKRFLSELQERSVLQGQTLAKKLEGKKRPTRKGLKGEKRKRESGHYHPLRKRGLLRKMGRHKRVGGGLF